MHNSYRLSSLIPQNTRYRHFFINLVFEHYAADRRKICKFFSISIVPLKNSNRQGKTSIFKVWRIVLGMKRIFIKSWLSDNRLLFHHFSLNESALLRSEVKYIKVCKNSVRKNPTWLPEVTCAKQRNTFPLLIKDSEIFRN